MVELQESALCASLSGRRNVGALVSVPPGDRILDLLRHVARAQTRFPDGPIRPRTDRSASPRPGRPPQLRLLDLLEQEGERALEDRARIAVGDLAAEEGLETPELVVALLADRELHAIALRRRGLDDRTTRGKSRRRTGEWR